jgi:uncharacterized protein
MKSSPAFEAYVGNASEGPNTLPRIVLACLLVLVVWVVGTFVVLLAAAAIAVRLRQDGEVPAVLDFNASMETLEHSRLWIVGLLLSVASLWPALWLALRWVHRRPLAGVYGVGRRIDRSHFWRGLAAGALIAVLSVLVGLLIDPEIAPTGVSWLVWVAALPAFVAIIFLQSSAEELLFRGYLMQSLAVRFRSPLVWAVIPIVLFAAIHWNPAAQPHMNAAGLAAIAALAAALALMVWRTGNLGAAFGAHAGNNIVALLFVAPEGDYASSALLRVRSMTEPGWTVGDAFWSAVAGFAMAALLALVLMHPRSPLRVAPGPAVVRTPEPEPA